MHREQDRRGGLRAGGIWRVDTAGKREKGKCRRQRWEVGRVEAPALGRQRAIICAVREWGPRVVWALNHVQLPQLCKGRSSSGLLVLLGHPIHLAWCLGQQTPSKWLQ